MTRKVKPLRIIETFAPNPVRCAPVLLRLDVGPDMEERTGGTLVGLKARG